MKSRWTARKLAGTVLCFSACRVSRFKFRCRVRFERVWLSLHLTNTPKDTLRFTSSAALSPLNTRHVKLIQIWLWLFEQTILCPFIRCSLLSFLSPQTYEKWQLTEKGERWFRVRAVNQCLTLRVSGCLWNIVFFFSLPSPPEAMQEEDKPAGGEEANEEGGEGAAKWENTVVKQTSSQCCYCVRHRWLQTETFGGGFFVRLYYLHAVDSVKNRTASTHLLQHSL